jgi:hypothetical protein
MIQNTLSNEQLLIVLRRQITVEPDHKRSRQNVWLPLTYANQRGWELGRVCCPRIVEPSREGTVCRSGVPLLEVQGPHELGGLHSQTHTSLLLELLFLILSKAVSNMIFRNSKLHGATYWKTVKLGSRRNPASRYWILEIHTRLQVCWRQVSNRTRSFVDVIWSSCDSSGKWHRLVWYVDDNISFPRWVILQTEF